LTKRITIAVPTHNRASQLGETLDSIGALEVPADSSLECVVIDNNSTDDTAGAVARAAAHAPFPMRCVLERSVGSSFARNRAIDEAKGDFIFFIDDDAVAEPRWAVEMLAAIEKDQLDAACGSVIPRWTVAPPRWLGPLLYVRLAVHDERTLAASSPAELAHIHNCFSANVGFPRRSLDLFGRFREDLGNVGANPMSGEDTELFQRIRAMGGLLGFALNARVHHIIPAARMRRAFLRRKSYAYGFGSAVAGGPTHNHLEKLARNAIRLVAALARGDTERAVYHELECANFVGYWRGRLKLARDHEDRSHRDIYRVR
jgi:glycosyltransferase involved in cell wall biosynthesis